MKITKQRLKDVSDLILNGYLSRDVFIGDYFITLRSLKNDERREIADKYKYVSKEYNFILIVELLSIVIASVNGFEIDRKKLFRRLLRFKSYIILQLYKIYNEFEDRINNASEVLDYYVESQESKYYWNLFKNTGTHISLDEIKNVNQFRYYWIVMSSFKDMIEDERKEWTKIEYMTNSICAFVNPKAYRRSQSGMNASKRFEEYDSKLDFRNSILSKLEETDEVEIQEDSENIQDSVMNADGEFFDKMKRQKEETKEEYKDRVNDLMVEQIKGKVIDEHDRLVRQHEASLLKKMLLQLRTKTEVTRNIRKKRREEEQSMNELAQDGVFREEANIIGDDDRIDQLDTEVKKQGFYHDGVSYFSIVNEKAFASIPLEERKLVFEEAMNEQLDIEKATEAFLKDLYQSDTKTEVDEQSAENGLESQEASEPIETIKVSIGRDGKHSESLEKVVVGLKEEGDSLEDEKIEEKKRELRNIAQKASQMNVEVKKQDLVKKKKTEKKEKLDRYRDALDRRNQALNRTNEIDDSDEIDSIFFSD